MSDNNEEDENMKINFFDSLQGNFKGKLTTEEHIVKFIYLLATVFGLIFFTVCNFIAMSASLNINKDNKSSIKYIYALSAFLFGFIYIIGYLFFFKIGQKGEKINFDKEKLFPV